MIKEIRMGVITTNSRTSPLRRSVLKPLENFLTKEYSKKLILKIKSVPP